MLVCSLAQARAVDFDALILLGGQDIGPSWYGEQRTYAQRPDRRRDHIEWALVRRALTAEVPSIGICRGHQMLAVAAGGTLAQDMIRQGVTSRHPNQHPLAVALAPLCAYLPEGDLIVNSYHHQAVIRVPDDFQTAALAPDGVIEAIWRPGALGVQWHPELMADADPRWRKLFAWFLDGLV
jgi:putative glutamine amidotransferase